MQRCRANQVTLRSAGHLFQTQVDLAGMYVSADHVRQAEVAAPQMVFGPLSLEYVSVVLQLCGRQRIKA